MDREFSDFFFSGRYNELTDPAFRRVGFVTSEGLTDGYLMVNALGGSDRMRTQWTDSNLLQAAFVCSRIEVGFTVFTDWV